MSKKKHRHRQQGRDWHGWVCKIPKVGLCWWAEPEKPKRNINCGKWVRVKFVEVMDD